MAWYPTPLHTIQGLSLIHIYSRDPNSLSYLYKVDSSLWLLMLDSCQYDPVNQVGGMIQSGTYNWMEPILYEAWENDTEVITVSHHNLLEQSGVSDAFYDDCTIDVYKRQIPKRVRGAAVLKRGNSL